MAQASSIVHLFPFVFGQRERDRNDGAHHNIKCKSETGMESHGVTNTSTRPPPFSRAGSSEVQDLESFQSLSPSSSSLKHCLALCRLLGTTPR
jgi:hypothetical protein